MRIGIRRIHKAGAAAFVAAATVVGLLPLAAGPAGAAQGMTVTPYAGADRFDTAAKMAVGAFTTADNAVIATGDNFPDALAGNYLAGTQNAPILLVHKDSVPSFTKTALSTLKVKNVTLLGQTAAIGTAVENELKGTASTNAAGGNLNVTRLGGADRYDTAQQVNTSPPAAGVGSVSGKKTAFIATGANFPDALFAGTVSWDLNFPMVLTTPNALSPQAKATLQNLGIGQVLILGGVNAVSAAVESEINAMGITTLQRFAGADRVDTNVKLNQYAATLPGAKLSKFFVATADNFPDALTAGPAAGRTDFTLIHAVAGNALPTNVATNIQQLNRPTATQAFIAGGDAVCNQACRDQVQQAGGGTTPGGAVSVTSRPELQSASIVQTNATQGTTVKYCFDEAITGAAAPDASKFHVYTSGDTKDPGGAATGAFNDSADTKCANVTFAGITTSAVAGSLTVATVEAVAVSGTGGAPSDTNPIGDAPLGATGTTSFQPGITAAPDLNSIGNFRSDPTAPSTNTLVDFVFDEVAYHVTGTATGYHLVQAAGNAASDTGCTYVSGDGSTTHTVTCGNPPTGAFSSSNVMRGYDVLNTVTDNPAGGGANFNPLQAADVAGSGTTDTPDLVSCTFQPDLKGKDNTTNIDRVIFKFDEPVAVAGGPGAFNIYQSSGGAGEKDGQAATAVFTAPTRSTANDTDVSVDYADGDLATAVGCSVETAAVAEATNATNTNRPDEVGVSNTGVAQTAGTTSGPDLNGVLVKPVKDAFGTITGYTATFSFDEDIASPANSAAFTLYDADGTALACGAVPTVGSTEETDNTATCTTFPGATLTQLANAVLGTVAAGAVTEQTGAGLTNPEGAAAATQSTT